MNTPGFTAESSCYITGGHYAAEVAAIGHAGTGLVLPAGCPTNPKCHFDPVEGCVWRLSLGWRGARVWEPCPPECCPCGPCTKDCGGHPTPC